jgi:hypothetical protein
MKNIYSLFILFLVFTATVKAQVSEQEFQALKALYNATGGDNWTNRTGWENINTTATKDDVTTAWFGISEIVDGHVISFRPSANNLIGTLPAQFCDLKWLKILNLDNNSLSGTLPAEMGNLSFLEEFTITSNKISGPLPQEFSNLRNLRSIYIGNNPLNTPFPADIIASLHSLANLQASQCQLSGVLPDIFDSLTVLSYIELSENRLEGELPQSINRLKNLSTLSLGSNQFSGNLPTLDSCSMLWEIVLWYNNFSGSIPASYGGLTTINNMYLSGNNLSGGIPNEIFTSALKRLYVDNNFFTFNGIEPVFNKINALSRKDYRTNKTFPLTQNAISFNQDEPLSLNAATLSVYNLGGNNNRYKWFKNDVEVYSGNSPVYTVASSGAADAGTYRFEVTNTVVTGLTLKSENITVSIIGENQPPTNITLTPLAVNEDYTGLLGTLSATDPDAVDNHAFSLATGNGTNDRDNNKFIISGNQLTMTSPANYETTQALNILITVNDGNGGIFTKAFVITVNNVNEAPVYNGQVTSNSIDENSPNGTTALILMAQDPEGTPVVFSITGGNEDGAFGIDGNKLIVADNSNLDYDVKKQYNLSVRASDGELSTTAILIIMLNKINQMPVVENATFAIDENSPLGTVVGSIVATDREGDPLTYSILTGNELSAFRLNGNSIVVDNSDVLNYEEHPVFNLTINVSDGISNVQASVTVNLNNVAENTDNDIVSFSVPGMEGEAIINETAHTIQVSVRDVDLSALAAVFTLSNEATSSPISGTILDFTTPKTITVTAQSGDVQEWVITVTMQVGTNDLGKAAIRFFPNPVQNILNLSGTTYGDRITLFSLSGKRVLEIEAFGNNEQIDISRLTSGAYLLTITSNKSVATYKITKQ